VPTRSRGLPARRSRAGRRRLGALLRRGDDGGVSSIELAVIAPSLLLLIFVVIQAALLFYARAVGLQSAREGVSQLRLYGQDQGTACTQQESKTEQSTTLYANSVGSGALTSVHVTAYCHYNPDGSTVTVHVTGQAVSLIGLTLHVDERAFGRVEQFQDDG
jgi:Flp pilus assembly protein TadG